MRVFAFTPGDGFLASWALFLLAAFLIAVPALALLLARLVLVAVRIKRNAEAAAGAALEISENTACAAHLAETLQIGGDLVEAARIIEAHGVVLGQVLTREQPRPAARR
jgi:hypothetical protein